jgi:tRNA (guanine37-N1)-methyltransferase
MNFHVITIFPAAFDSYLKESIIGRAIKNKKINIKFYNPRDFVKTGDWYKQVDDRPYGGGPGMVMQAEPILKAVSKIKKNKKTKIIIFSPSGKKFTNEYAKNLARKYTDVVMISGRYEGIDARVKKILKAEDISIGDYVLTGGELPAMVLIDSTARQIPGVLHKSESLEESRISSSEVYTRPETLKYKGKSYKVPKVLTGGNHAEIEAWKKNRAVV